MARNSKNKTVKTWALNENKPGIKGFMEAKAIRFVAIKVSEEGWTDVGIFCNNKNVIRLLNDDSSPDKFLQTLLGDIRLMKLNVGMFYFDYYDTNIDLFSSKIADYLLN